MARLPAAGSWKWRMWNALTRAHASVYRRSGGRVGRTFRGAPVLLLDHVGRKSGKRRTNPLLFLADGDDLVIVASNGGAPRHPSWWLNLREHPDTTVQVYGEKRHVRARVAGPAERERLWPRLVEMYPDYAAYQRHTKREIPVVLLRSAERAGAASS
jgi:deazaflavin-dependent oxidoreductase (nitroreductase family)